MNKAWWAGSSRRRLVTRRTAPILMSSAAETPAANSSAPSSVSSSDAGKVMAGDTAVMVSLVAAVNHKRLTFPQVQLQPNRLAQCYHGGHVTNNWVNRAAQRGIIQVPGI